MKNQLNIVGITILSIFLLSGCVQQTDENKESGTPLETTQVTHDYPHIAGYISSGQDLLEVEEAKYDIIYSSDIDQERAEILKERNPNMIILYQSPASYMFDSAVPVIEAVTDMEITDEFWLEDTEGQRCGYGWTPEMWAIDINKPENIEIMAQFFSNILAYQPQYDGLFFDVVEESSRCDAMSDSEWSEQTAELLSAIREEVGDKIILTNSGYNYDTNTPYLQHINGYALESFLSGAAGYDEGLETVEFVLEKCKEPHFLIFTVYSENTVTKQPIDTKNMRLALSLSLLNNITYLCYDDSLEDVGSILWQQEFSAEIGEPLGSYYEKDNAYFREFENGIVVSSPNTNVTVNFDDTYTDATIGEISTSFTIEQGDGRIFIL